MKKITMKKIMTIVPVVALILVCGLNVAASRKPLTIYTCGDSTMADRVDTAAVPERGWVQLLPSFLTDDVMIKNHAKNGRSTKSFIAEGRWAAVKKELKRGDVVILQFGHNDIYEFDPTRYSSVVDFEKNLRLMVQEAKDAHARVVLCTPIAVRAFNIHTEDFISRLGSYPEAVRRVAEAEDVPLLDLHKLTSNWIETLGEEASIPYFCHVAAGKYAKYPEGKQDDLHTSEAGALEVAGMAAKEIVRKEIKFLTPYIQIPDEVVAKYTTPCGIK